MHENINKFKPYGCIIADKQSDLPKVIVSWYPYFLNMKGYGCDTAEVIRKKTCPLL